MNKQQRTTLELFLVMLGGIGLFAAWIVDLNMNIVHIWAITATLLILLVAAVFAVRRWL